MSDEVEPPGSRARLLTSHLPRVLVLGLLLALPALCLSAVQARSPSPLSAARSTAPRAAGPSASALESAPDAVTATRQETLPSDDPYLGVARLLHEQGVRIWWESDLVARWLEGRSAFDAAVRRLGALAEQPGTVGFKVADEIGYHDGLTTPATARAFLHDARSALARVAPGKEILVDAVVLELGCLPRTTEALECAERARAEAPAASINAITSYLRAGLIDRLDLSTGLGAPDVYPNNSLAAAQDFAWTYVKAGPWPDLTRLQSRKALAAAGGFKADASEASKLYIDIPTEHGAHGTDIWTWRQRYEDQTFSLFDSHPTTDPLWFVLLDERSRGRTLFTHMTPSAMPTQRSERVRECDLAARIFTDVFVAAGTG